MRINDNLKLRKIGRRYMIVDVSSSDVDFTNVYSLNESAAWLWEKIGRKEVEEEELVDWLCDRYDVEHEKAAVDVHKIIELWITHGLLIR